MRYIMAIVHLSGPEIFETAAALLDFDGMETEHITDDCVHGFVLDMDVYRETVKSYEGIPWVDYPIEHADYLRSSLEFYMNEFPNGTRFLWFVVDA